MKSDPRAPGDACATWDRGSDAEAAAVGGRIGGVQFRPLASSPALSKRLSPRRVGSECEEPEGGGGWSVGSECGSTGGGGAHRPGVDGPPPAS